MYTAYGHLTYCTNIHAGETWNDHYGKLEKSIPTIKHQLSPQKPFGIGLRLSNTASLELRKEANLESFKKWLQDNECYVFTMNGFPYGGFHNTKVKDSVHAPDWTTSDRVQYTIRLAQILAALLPEGMDGGISTSPLSYKYWHKQDDQAAIFETVTLQILQVVEQLVKIRTSSGKLIHIDIEPEPDGLVENGPEFLQWYTGYLLPFGVSFLKEKFQYGAAEAEAAIKDHIQICYDVCHFAVGYEDQVEMIQQLRLHGIKTGKIQISSALKAKILSGKKEAILEAFSKFNESTYLHQVVALQNDGHLKRYSDLPEALQEQDLSSQLEWRAHFHVPLFIQEYGLLQSTRQEILQVLSQHKQHPFTNHLEIETYTWEVLPEELRIPLDESIIRELQWVIDHLQS